MLAYLGATLWTTSSMCTNRPHLGPTSSRADGLALVKCPDGKLGLTPLADGNVVQL
jgi:hypothetical protein